MGRSGHPAGTEQISMWEGDGRWTLLHLETYGSSSRAIPGKVSQSLQLDRDGARQLRDLIDQAFPDLGG